MDEKCVFCGSYDVVMKTKAGNPICAKCANKAPGSVVKNEKVDKLTASILSALALKKKAA